MNACDAIMNLTEKLLCILSLSQQKVSGCARHGKFIGDILKLGCSTPNLKVVPGKNVSDNSLLIEKNALS